MKRTILRSALLLCATVMLSGCGQVLQLSQNPDVQKTVKAILTNVSTMAQQRQGTPVNYSGTISAQLLKKNAQGEYLFVNGTGKKTPSQATLNTTQSQTAVGMTIPALTIDGATMTAVQLANLAATTTGNSTSIAVGDNTSADATLTVGGTAYPITAVYFNDCTYTTEGVFTGTMMQIYFGPNSEYVADLTFTGKKVQ